MKKYGRKRVLETKFLYCNKHGDTDHVLTGIKVQKWKCCKCTVDYSAAYKKRQKIKAVEYKGGKCQSCGYCKSLACLDFHHQDPLLKDFNLSGTGVCKSWAKLVKELDACQLLCRNCHNEIHEKIDQARIKKKNESLAISNYDRKTIHKINCKKLGIRPSP